MKEDYLWDKTGEDQEIEKLESVLAVFRCQESEPPALPVVNLVPVAGKAAWWRLSLAFAAFAVIAVVIGIWFQVSRKEMVSDRTALTAQPQNIDEPQNAPPVNVAHNVLPETAKKTMPDAERRRTRIRRAIPAAFLGDRTIAKKIRIQKPIPKLTDEEKYAYNRLILALAVTSSKLKLVQDTISQIEEGKTAGSTNDR